MLVGSKSGRGGAPRGPGAASGVCIGLFFTTALGAWSGCQPFRHCDPVDEPAIGQLPQRLSETGLYASIATQTIAADVLSFRPRFELWSDGASKRRFIRLPPGTQIDTSDMDDWQFPVGTQVWKEFTRSGERVETRLLQRSSGGWVGLAYVWQPDGADAVATPYGAIDVLGTLHDVPAANECEACHGGRKSHVLGFSAVQLAQPGDPDSLSLSELIAGELLSRPPAKAPSVPGNDTQQAALGYLHANCSHCHNASRPERSGARCFDPQSDVDFSLRAEQGPEPSKSNTYRTAAGECFEPGRPDQSKLIELVSERSRFRQMPPLATQLVDEAAVKLLRRWIEEM